MPKMWSRDLPAFTNMGGCKLPITETYLSYDGPVIFLTKIGFENYLVSKVDLCEDGYILIASSVNIDGHQEFLKINSSDVSAIKNSISEFMDQPQHIVGTISIINEGTHNVVIKVLNTNELKCNFSADDFLIMKRNPDFRTGNKLEVYGVVRKRSRRDYMNCQGAGIVQLP